MVEMFHSVYNFKTQGAIFFQFTAPLYNALPSAVTNSRKSPAILVALQQIVSYKETISIVAKSSDIIRCVVECLSIINVTFDVAKVIYSVIEYLLDFDDGKCIHPFAEVRNTLNFLGYFCLSKVCVLMFLDDCSNVYKTIPRKEHS